MPAALTRQEATSIRDEAPDQTMGATMGRGQEGVDGGEGDK